jgi:hypothetical protein
LHSPKPNAGLLGFDALISGKPPPAGRVCNAEFEYRFNRRYDLAAMMPRLGYVAVRTPPMPYRLLKLAEDHA